MKKVINIGNTNKTSKLNILFRGGPVLESVTIVDYTGRLSENDIKNQVLNFLETMGGKRPRGRPPKKKRGRPRTVNFKPRKPMTEEHKNNIRKALKKRWKQNR